MLAIWTAEKWGPLPSVWWVCLGLIALAVLFSIGNGLVNRVYVPVDGLVQGVVGRMGSGKSLLIVMRVLLPFCRGLAKRGFVRSMTGRPMTRVITNFRFDPGLAGVEVLTVQPGADRSIFGSLIDLAHEIGQREGPWYDSAGIMQDGSKAMPADAEPARLANGALSYTRQPILNALVVLDEMHLFANSSKLALGDEASWIISMARKLNCELWWASQHEMKVHKRLRDESSSIWLAGKLTGLGAMFVGSGWHVAREYHSPALVERARNSLGSTGAPKASDRRVYRFTKDTKRFYNSFELLVPDPSPSAGRGGPKRSRPATSDHASDEAPEFADA